MAQFPDYVAPMPEHFDPTINGPEQYAIRFDYDRPPLTANQRLHWRERATRTAAIRSTTRFMAHRIPELGRCEVELTWIVTDRRRRDADNIVPTLKAMCDGLVDAGVVSDDTPNLMVKRMPEIRIGASPHMVLLVTRLGKDAT
jgi:crossover junction endodeoxyribonuclease RusA